MSAIRPIRVVLVDDCPQYRQVLALHLDSNDIVVAGEGDDGQSGLDAVLGTEPDLVVTDLQMPGTDGLWLTREIRASRPTLPVIMVTSSAGSPAVAKQAYDVGVTELVSKSVGPAAVAAIVRMRDPGRRVA